MKLPLVQEKLEELLQYLGADYQKIVIKKSEIPGHVTYEIITDDHALLIGRDGKNLQALTHVLHRLLEREEGRNSGDFLIDVGGYQEKRISELKSKIEEKIQQVATQRVSVELPPMSAFERRITHSVIASYPHLQSASVGQGSERRVVISLVH